MFDQNFEVFSEYKGIKADFNTHLFFKRFIAYKSMGF